jgi:nitroimidazol reductase NimA-like FMN-containing flavoprotein (pyridoxamine 5'-phosphate oxidase superfamily)
MRREMRRKERQLTPEETEAILRKCQYGVLSTVCEDGYPYGLPISYVYEDGKIYFHHTKESSMMKENITGEVRACFTVVGDTELLPAKFATRYESVIAFGKIRESEDKTGILMRLVKRFSADYLEQGEKAVKTAAERVSVYEFDIEQVTGKARKER